MKFKPKKTTAQADSAFVQSYLSENCRTSIFIRASHVMLIRTRIDPIGVTPIPYYTEPYIEKKYADKSHPSMKTRTGLSWAMVSYQRVACTAAIFSVLFWPDAMLDDRCAIQRQAAVTAYFSSKQLLLFVFAGGWCTDQIRITSMWSMPDNEHDVTIAC